MNKSIIRKIPGFKLLYRFKKNFRYINSFSSDRKIFRKNYMYSNRVTKEKLEYELLLEIHKLEKGFAVVNPRPFGIEKINKIIDILVSYENKNFVKNFSYNAGYSALFEYKKFYEEHDWCDTEQYKHVSKFLNNRKFEYVNVGAFDLKKEDIINDAMIDYKKFVSSRRSVRNFASEKVSKKLVLDAISIANYSPSACNRQMCKVYLIDSEKNKKLVESYAQGLGLFDLKNANYLLVTFDLSSNYFYGERNQGWFNAGLFSMNLVNSLHSFGIGSCFVQFGNTNKEEKQLKSMLKIPTSERIAIIITYGFYSSISRIPYSTRKPLSEIYNER